MLSLSHCLACPRECGADRLAGEKGYCQAGGTLRAARAMIHEGEEPCLIGPPKDQQKAPARYGAGAVFFSGCNLGCVFCQNAAISHENVGWNITEEKLGQILLSLQNRQAACLDLVTPTPYEPILRRVLTRIKPQLTIPVVYNCGGYESTQALQELEGLVDIYLPDLKYFDPALSSRYSQAPDYFEKAKAALAEMFRQCGPVEFDENGQMKKGLLVRHLVLPGCLHDSLKLIDYLADTFAEGSIRISLLSQYTPYGDLTEYPQIRRRLTTYEYERVVDHALERGLMGYRQARSSGTMQMLPEFDGRGIIC